MNWKRRVGILAILALAQAGVIVCYQGFLAPGPTAAQPPAGVNPEPSKPAPVAEAPKDIPLPIPTAEPPVVPKGDSVAVPVPVAPKDEPKLLPPALTDLPPVAPDAKPAAPSLPDVIPVGGEVKPPLPLPGTPAGAGNKDIDDLLRKQAAQVSDKPPPPPPLPGLIDPSLTQAGGQKPLPPTPKIDEKKDGAPSPTIVPKDEQPSRSAPPGLPHAGAQPKHPQDVPPPPTDTLHRPQAGSQEVPVPPPSLPKQQPEKQGQWKNPAADVACPWVLRVEIVKGRTLLTASTGKEIQFRVSCDRLDLAAPNGRIQAMGNVKLSSEGLEGSCEALIIAWQEDRVTLEGQAELRYQRDGQEVDLKSTKLSLRVSTARTEEPRTRRDAPKSSPERPTLIRSEATQPPQPGRAPVVIESRDSRLD